MCQQIKAKLLKFQCFDLLNNKYLFTLKIDNYYKKTEI